MERPSRSEGAHLRQAGRAEGRTRTAHRSRWRFLTAVCLGAAIFLLLVAAVRLAPRLANRVESVADSKEAIAVPAPPVTASPSPSGVVLSAVSASASTAKPLPSPSPTPVPTEEPYEGELIARYALQFDGGKYRYGGSDPSTGFDCSGLVSYVYRQFGYRLHRVAADQATDGVGVQLPEELLPGDILCFSWYTGSYINHAGIYIGDGMFIHAMDTEHGVLITSLEEYLETHNCIARRIVGSVHKYTLAEIEAMEQQEAYLLWLRSEEERLERERLEKEAAAKQTPPPATIPDPDAQKREEEERRRQEEIAQAWEDILREEPAEVPPEVPAEVPAEISAEIPAELPAELPMEIIPAENPAQAEPVFEEITEEALPEP